MRFASSCWLLALALAVHDPAARAAEAFAPVGAKATLSVEYQYESAGKKQDANDLREWRARRTVSMVADLASQSPTALPTMQALDAAQTAKLDKQTEQMGRMANEMAPLTADVEKLMAKCGDDDKCIEREAMKLGLAMAGTPKADAVLKTGKQTAEVVKPGAPRYQAWRTTAQRGSYTIDETARSVLADPICLPTQRCTRNEVRKGAGALPSNTAVAQGVGAFNAVEVDTAKKTLTIALPVPALPLPYTETITTNEPDGARDTPTPKGPQPRQLVFRTSADGNNKPITVALKGGWRSQSGEQIIQVKGDAGKLTVRWRFEAQ